MKADAAFGRAGLTPGAADRRNDRRFPDGAHFRIEIPSVEEPPRARAVLEAAREHGVVVNRVSQGSGAMLLSECELREMAAVAAEAGSRCRSSSGRARASASARTRAPRTARRRARQMRGLRGLAYAVEDVSARSRRASGASSIADLGPADGRSAEMQRAGELPAECVLEDLGRDGALEPRERVACWSSLGASTVNIPSDVTLAELAELRAATSLPLDLYVESPDSLGGVVRGNELAELVAVGAPLYAKFGLRNSRPLYPAGEHLYDEAVAIARAKVARAAVALEWLGRLDGTLVQSSPGAAGLAVPAAPGTPDADHQSYRPGGGAGTAPMSIEGGGESMHRSNRRLEPLPSRWWRARPPRRVSAPGPRAAPSPRPRAPRRRPRRRASRRARSATGSPAAASTTSTLRSATWRRAS